MRTVTETFNVYKFDELSPEVQTKWLDKHRDWNTEVFDWSDDTREDYQNTLNEIGFEGAKVEFSGFSCQGDGASFTAERLDIPKLLKKLDETSNNSKKFNRFIPKLWNSGAFSLSIKVLSYNYSHEGTKRVELDDCIPERLKRLGLLVSDFRDEVEALRLDLCRDFYTGLQNEYDYLTSDDAIKESVDCNDLEFLENGNIYRE